jgi:hypothetical protein
VDGSLLEDARKLRSGMTDAALVDEALAALLARYRSAEVDASYAAYDEHPLDEPDEWGTWRRSDGRLQRRDRRPRSWGSVVVRAGRDGDDPVPLRSAVNLDSIESVSIAILTSRLGRLAETRVREICAALAVAVDCSG